MQSVSPKFNISWFSSWNIQAKQKAKKGLFWTYSKFDFNGKVQEISRGKVWKWSKFGKGDHDGWLYQDTSDSQNITYVFDDFSTVIQGIFHDRILIEGHASRIVAFRCKKVWSVYNNQSVLKNFIFGQIFQSFFSFAQTNNLFNDKGSLVRIF